MKTISKIIARLEENNITTYNYKEKGEICGYELNTYTDAGVHQIVFVDFRDTGKYPNNPAHFIQLYNNRVNDIDIDEEVEINMENKHFKQSFSLTDAVKDFKDWKERLQGIFSKKTPQQRQFEQVQMKFRSLLAEMEETLQLMPKRGDVPSECQRTAISNQLRGLDHCINGITLEDFTPNDYSADFKLSYS